MGRKERRTSRPKEEHIDTQGWQDPALFERFEPVRRYVRPANALVVAGTLDRYTSPDLRIVEIGSGIGELVHNLLPADSPFTSAIEQTEQSANLVAEVRRKYPESRIRQANVYGLPYAAESIDTLIGFSSFDTFQDMRKAVTEMDRVLKPGGRIIHFLDINASSHPLFQNADNDFPKQIPIGDVDTQSILFIDRSDFSTEISRLRRNPAYAGYAQWLEQVSREPEKEQRKPSHPEYLPYFGSTIRKIKESDIQHSLVTTNDYFHDRFINALGKRNFDVITSGLETGIYDVEEPTALNSTNNVVTHALGVLNTERDDTLPPGVIRLISKIDVIVAEKPAA